MTLPLLIAMERIDGLRDRLRAGDPSEEEIPALLESVQAVGATNEALDRARLLVREGLEALEVLPMTPYRKALEQLAHHLVDRIA
jgi:geranylgeranyl pyrophosphate synthase